MDGFIKPKYDKIINLDNNNNINYINQTEVVY